MNTLKTRVLPFLFSLVLLLSIWWGVASLGNFPAWQLPTPDLVAKELVLYIPNETFGLDLASTSYIAVIGLVLSILVGVGGAVLLHFYPLLKQIVLPLLLFSQNVPIIVLAPLLVIWFGFGMLAKILIVLLVCFFPIIIAVLDGLEQGDRTLANYLAMAGATRWEKFRYLSLPTAMPAFFSSCKLAATYSVMGAVIAEWLGTEHGLGLMMTQAASSFRTDRVFVAIGVVVVLSSSFFFVIWLLEQLWRRKRKMT
jgi:ABC-type nitrate/sulfonate/bicarbonate transport system permease component